jgi:hypothetical protein
MRNLHRYLWLVLSVSLGVATGIRAQATDSVPRELALALLGQWRGYIDYSALFVGRAPPAFPTALIPPGAPVLI